MELYLIRHGQSTNNRGDSPRLADPPLTELGKEQARQAGQSLKDEGIIRLYCSPMLRTLQTAQIIGDNLDLSPHIFVGLHEWGGVWEDRGDKVAIQLPGLTRSEMREICPSVVLPKDVTDQGWWFQGWAGAEKMLQLAHGNALAFIAHLKVHHDGTDERVAAVTHGGSGSSLLSALFSLPPDVDYERFSQNNTGLSKLSITLERTQLRYLNRIDHLLKKMVTS